MLHERLVEIPKKISGGIKSVRAIPAMRPTFTPKILRTIRQRKSTRKIHFAPEPKTFCNKSLVRAIGLARMFFSSAATILKSPSSALLVT